jgi:hypothetical protein
MHYVFTDFDHRRMTEFYVEGVESYIQPALENSTTWSVLYSPEVATFDGKVISELCWYRIMSWHARENPQVGIYSDFEPVFRAIGVELKKNGLKAGLSGDASDYGDELQRLSRIEQLQIRLNLRSVIASAASNEIAGIMRGLPIDKIVDMARLRKLVRPNLKIHLNATTPTPYSTTISPMNLWFLRLAIYAGDVVYVSGEIKRAEKTDTGFRVHLKNGQVHSYDHVCTRYGASAAHRGLKGLRPRNRRDHYGEWLLEFPFFYEPRNKRGIGTRRNLAISALERQLPARRKQSPAKGPRQVNKDLYKIWLTGFFKKTAQERDPQGWLSAQLRKRNHMRFVETEFTP